MPRSTLPLISLVTLSLIGCASQPEKIATSYVSPLQYQDYTCKQIGMELGSVTRRANELAGTLKKKADNDAIQMGVGLILLWPTLFALEGGDGAEAAEFARLKGERDALEQAAVQKSCSLTEIPKIVTTPPAAKKTKEDSRQ